MNSKANNPLLKSWMPVSENSDFPIQNIPFGVYSDNKVAHHACTAIGEHIVDLYELSRNGYFDALNIPQEYFKSAVLNDLIAMGKTTTNHLRERISELLRDTNTELQNHKELHFLVFKKQSEVKMLLPVHVGDYTDFYSSIDHATNVGTMFRDPANALLPNWKHLPVGYHGRASSICVSGHSFHRPKGQTKPADAELPVFGPSKLLDIELETAFIIGKSTNMGESVSTEKADDYIFGMVLFNDWSARDIQQWEYVPLGPFLGKNFGSTISPWIVTLDALEPFRVPGPEQFPHVLPYLATEGNKNFDVNLEVLIQPDGGEATTVCRSNAKYLYWNVNQQLAHHTVNGCNVQVGDLYASGTISGPSPGSYGSLLELSWNGQRPLHLANGANRKFLEDGDTVIIRGFAGKDKVRIGFGKCEGKILPAL